MATDTTYLLGLGGSGPDPSPAAGLRIGARLRLRRPPPAGPGAGGRHRVVEVRDADGRLLGQLPPDDASAVGELLDAGLPATARVSALVPAFRRQRVQLAIEVGPMVGDPEPPRAATQGVVCSAARDDPTMRHRPCGTGDGAIPGPRRRAAAPPFPGRGSRG